ncbi:polyketide synthase [Phlyctema vagabunda]|uniref:Polyketide synthase n=1 Tax=Phlyctema vagabunda TaxID=108571 RepID=A0ABR4P297_9HELO
MASTIPHDTNGHTPIVFTTDQILNGGSNANPEANLNGVSNDTYKMPSPEVQHEDNQNKKNGHKQVNGHKETLEPIAIVGMALRLPGDIHTPEELWKLLVEKKTTRRPVPADRYNIDGFYSASKQGGSVGLQQGHFFSDKDGLDLFDTSFFTMSKAEVEALDPQQRLLLEVVFECMENGGQKNWRGTNTGVFVGTWGDDWLDLKAKDIQRAGVFNITGTGDFAISNRVSYEYDLKGPSLTIKAACASSLIGLHEACEALSSGECSSAIVAGTNVIIAPTMTIAQSEAGVLSPTGECRTFDASANGYSRGEAINAIFIKKLSDAVRDNDPIRAVIRATSSNCDGRSNGMTNPRPEGHERLIRRAYETARLEDYTDTPFVECHGTGTQTGDPLELEAIGKLFGGHKGVYIGSIKPNVGHAEGASGISSVIKAVMALEHKTIPPNVNFKTPNPRINFERDNMTVPLDPTPWPQDRPERISVNCFGIGGANAHVIIDSAASFRLDQKATAVNGHTTNGHSDHRPKLLVFSASHNDSLRKSAVEIQDYVGKNPSHLEDLAYTLSMRREHLVLRAFTVENGTSEAELNVAEKAKQTPKINFVFTGQGAQWPCMGKELMEDFPGFKADIQFLSDILAKLPEPPSWNLVDELSKPESESELEDAIYAQPLLTAIQIALVNFLRRLGISPAAVMGHSSGEIAAAYATDALTAEEAIITAYYRGFITKGYKRRGAMAAIGLGKAEVSLYLERGVVVACENSPVSVTLSGDEDQVDAVIEQLKYDDPNLFARRIKTGGMAYHSHHMAELGDTYEDLLAPYVFGQAPNVPFFSSVTGKRITTSELGRSYWRRNLESPVKFYSAIRACVEAQIGDQLFLEVGPHSALAGPLRQIFKALSYKDELIYNPTLVRGKDSTVSMLNSIGKLYLNAVPINFEPLSFSGRTLTDLPVYPWRHDTSYWSESRITKEWILEGNEFEPTWRNLLNLLNVPWIQDHKVLDDIVFPCAGYIAMAGEAIRQLSSSNDYSLRNLVIKTGLVLQDTHPTEIITTLRPARLTTTLDSSWYEFSISSHNGIAWTRHCTGQVKAGKDIQYQVHKNDRPIAALPRTVASPYSAMKKVGLNYGQTFQGLRDISATPGKNTAVATLSPCLESETFYQLHPTTIDHCLQLFAFAPCEGVTRKFTKLVVPTQIEHIYISADNHEAELRAEAIASASKPTGTIRGEVVLMALDKLLLSLIGGKFTPLEDETGIEEVDTVAAARLNWRPDMDFTNLKELMIVSEKDPKAIEAVENYALLCTTEIRYQISQLEGRFCAEHMTKFSRWLDGHFEEAQKGENKLLPESQALVNLTTEERQSLIAKMRVELQEQEFAPAAELISRLLDNCVGCFSGTTEALEIYLKDGGLTNVYNLTADRVDSSPFFLATGHLNPTMKILEIGAGTGGTTLIALQALMSINGERMYSSYTYTDISSGFFGTAKERFAEYPGIEFKVLDASKDPSEQGFQFGTYDLIIASNVIHATPVLKDTLTHVRKLLSLRGRFFLQELAPSGSKLNNLIMGILPGWWLGEADNRPMAPSVSVERWDQELQAAGFAPIESVVYDDPDLDKHIGMNIIAHPAKRVDEFKAITLLHKESQSDTGSLQDIEDILLEDGYFVDRCALGDPIPQSQDVISVLEYEEPWVFGLESGDFTYLKEMLLDIGSSSILWVTRSSQIDCEDPRFSQCLGLARTIRSELSIPFATLELDTVGPSAINAILKVFTKLQATISDFQPDYEYILKNDVINIGRYHWTNVEKELAFYSNIDKQPLKLDVGRPGLLSSLRWSPYSLEPLGYSEVVIAPRCVGMNFRDVLVTMGLVDSGSVGLGLEGSGVITAIGSDVNDLQVGDRVMTMGQNYFSTQTIATADHVVKIPDTLTFEDAATMPCVYVTVIHALLKMAEIRKGQSILIQSACGGVGIAAIQICRMVGAQIYCTVGNDEKVKHLTDSFAIPRNHIFHSRDASFLRDVMRETNDRGVDIVLNSLSGELLHTSWKCVATRGKMIEIGKRDFIGRAQLDMDLFEANRSFIGVDLATLPDCYNELLKETICLYEQGHIKPISPITAFEGSNVEDAFRYMQQGVHIGKIVVRIPEDEAQLPVTPVPRDLQLRSDVSYLLAGGLGGLGTAISTWFVECGAKHIVYITRSGGKSPEDQAFFHELAIQGCSVQAIQGDVTVLEDVQNAIRSATKPIAGVLDLAMVLKDEKLPEMSHADWITAVGPKVDGTWNLHKALEGVALDFFVLFSSVSGCFGIAHQANYASGNAFQDAFVQYRHSLGLPASVLDVGAMDDIGYVTKNQTVQDSLRSAGMFFLREKDLLDALHLSIKQSLPSSAPFSKSEGFTETSQLAIGMRATKSMSDPSNRVIWKRDKRVDILRNLENRATEGVSSGVDDQLAAFLASVELDKSILDTSESLEVLTKEIGICVYKFMLQPIEDLDIKRSLNSLGVDSLVTIEVRNWLRRSMAVEVSTLEILNGGTIEMLGITVMERLKERLELKEGGKE